MGDKKPLHEHFRDYTKEEIEEIKKKVCIAHKCPYLVSIADSPKSYEKVNIINKFCCFYAVRAQHSRGCMPDECTHYNDKNVKKHTPKY